MWCALFPSITCNSCTRQGRAWNLVQFYGLQSLQFFHVLWYATSKALFLLQQRKNYNNKPTGRFPFSNLITEILALLNNIFIFFLLQNKLIKYDAFYGNLNMPKPLFSGGKKHNIMKNEIETSPLHTCIFSTHFRKAWSVTSESCKGDRKSSESLKRFQICLHNTLFNRCLPLPTDAQSIFLSSLLSKHDRVQCVLSALK